MKYFMIGVLLLSVSCNSHKTITGLTGIYTSSYEHEFGKTDDTLILTKANKADNLYKIIRHSGIIKKMQDKEFPKEIITDTWTLQFDPTNETLTELRTGKIVVWDEKSLILMIGNRKYKKI